MKICLKHQGVVDHMVRQINDDLIGAVVTDIRINYYDSMNAVMEMTLVKDGIEYQLDDISTDWDSSEFVIERVGVNND